VTRSALAAMVSAGLSAVFEGKKGCVHHVEVFELVGLAVDVEHRCGRIGAESDCAAQVPHRVLGRSS